MRTLVIAPFFFTALATAAIADEKPVQLKKAPGPDKVEGNCASCLLPR